MRDVAEPSFDAILASRLPAFSEPEAVEVASRTFGLAASTATNLGSERDQTFLLQGAGGERLAIMKISNAAEDPATLDMEALAVLHARRADPTLPVALPRLVPGADPEREGAAAYRTTIDAPDGSHFVRLYDVLTGHGRSDPLALSDAAIGDWGEMTARLARALRGFTHPKAQRTMLWDLQHALTTRSMLPDIRDPDRRAAVAEVLDRFEARVVPVWPTLRAQCVHTDFTIDNALVDDDGRITGIVDFGDMSYSALTVDIASVINSMANGRAGDELFRVSRLVIDGYERVTPLEPIELELMAEFIAARSAVDDRDPRLAGGPRPGGCRVRRALHGLGRGHRPDHPRHRLGRVRAPARGSATARSGGAGGPRRSPCRGPWTGARAPHLRASDPDGECSRRLDDRHGRTPVPRRVQQRAVRRAQPSTGRGRDRPPGTAPQHEHAVSAPVGDRARGAARGHLPGRPRHGPVRQFRVGGERPGVADGDRLHRESRRAVHDPRLPRHLGGQRRPLARELGAGCRAGLDRDLGAARHVSRDERRPGGVRGRARTPPVARVRARGDDPRWRPDERRLLRPRPGVRAGARPADAGRRWPVDRRRSAGWPRPDGRGDVVVPAVRHHARLRHPRQADGQRPPGGRGHHPARDRGPVRRRDRVLQHVRRQPRVRGRGPGRARRPRGRARPATSPGGRRGTSGRHP